MAIFRALAQDEGGGVIIVTHSPGGGGAIGCSGVPLRYCGTFGSSDNTLRGIPLTTDADSRSPSVVCELLKL